MTASRAAVVAMVACLASVLPAAGAPPILRGLGIDETLDGIAILAPALDLAHVKAADLPVFVRLLVKRAALEPASPGLDQLDARLGVYAGLHVPVVLVLTDPPTAAADIDNWGETLRALAGRCRGQVLAYQVGDRLAGADRPSPKDYAYLVKFVAVQVRSVDSAALVIEGSLAAAGAAEWQEQLYREDVAAYLNAVALSASPTDEGRAGVESALEALDHLAARDHPGALLGVTGLPLPESGRQGAERFIGWHLAHMGGRTSFTTCVATAETVARALVAAATIKDIIGGEVVTLDEQASALALTINGRAVTGTLPHRLLYNLTTFATYLVCPAPGADAGQVLQVGVHLASAGTTALRDPSALAMVKLRDVVRDETAKTTTARFELPGEPVVLDFNFGAEEVYAMRSEASERATPTVDEIIFRYQQRDAAQAAAVHNYLAHARISIHFQPTALDSYDVVMENQFFAGPDVTEWQELSFSLNGTRWGRNRPPFPLLQPEKVLSLPLSLRLNRDYAYRLVGLERVGDRPCYVVAFDPIDPTRSLYRGRVWIDTENYARLKVQAVQTRLSAPVVSNEEVQTFEPLTRVGDRPVYLFTRLISRQIMTIAGRNLLIEKDVVFSDFHVNDETFASRREQARRSDDIMYRDSDRGLQHLVKRGGERVVSDRLTTTAKALVVGATIDPSYDSPLPLFGIDYLNFDFLGRGLQFGFIFSGVLGAGNLQKTHLAGTKLDLSVDFYGIVVKSNDQVYDANGERKDERLQTRPASTGVNLGYQVTDFQKITANVHVQYDQYTASAGNTAASFTLPASTFTTSGGFNYEYRRAGYSLLGSWTWFRRARWQPWGDESTFDPSTRTYDKYSVGLSKDFYFEPFSKIHLNAAYYGGERLDRFSMYRSGLFDETRMRGVPSAGIRFSELALLRASYSFNLFDRFRLSAYVDHANGRTPDVSAWQPTTGVGFEVNFAGPKTTMLKIGVGKGFLPPIYRGSGSVVVEFMVFKPL
jgi:hypothetical protein